MKKVKTFSLMIVFVFCLYSYSFADGWSGGYYGQDNQAKTPTEDKLGRKYYSAGCLMYFRIDEIVTNGFISRYQKYTVVVSGQERNARKSAIITGIETGSLVSGEYWHSDKLVQFGIYTNVATKEQFLWLIESKEDSAPVKSSEELKKVSASQKRGLKNTDIYIKHKKLGQ